MTSPFDFALELYEPSQRVGSAPTPLAFARVDVAPTLFVLHAQLWDPLKKKLRSPPSHAFVLGAKAARADILGGPSDADGLAVVPWGPEAVAHPEHDWTLFFVPFPASDPSKFLEWKERFAHDGGAYWDLDGDIWVFEHELARVERRRLVRVPMWSSAMKALAGGFDVAPKDRSDFAARGVFSGDELAPYGTRDKPWELQLDFKWYHAFVRHAYYDSGAKVERDGAPGLVVRALDAHGALLGAGTALDGHDGVAYVLQSRTAAQSTDVHYTFATDEAGVTPTAIYVDLSKKPVDAGVAPKKDERLVAVEVSAIDAAPKARRARRMLPRVWHSLGMHARLGGARHAWSGAIDGKAPVTSAKDPLVFDLDDTVLAAVSGDHLKLAPLPAAARLTFLDHVLAVKDVDAAEPYYSTSPTKRADLLLAEEGIIANGKELSDQTLVVHHEGNFHLLREEHLTGTPGKDLYVGARAAVSGRMPHTIFSAGATDLGDRLGRYELIFVPDAIARRHDGKDVEYCHLIVHLGMDMQVSTLGPIDASGVEYRPTAGDLADLKVQVGEVMRLWDQKHAAHPGSPYTKDVWIVPDGGVHTGDRVVRLRHFFALRTDGTAMLTLYAGQGPDRTNFSNRAYATSNSVYIPNPYGSQVGDIAPKDDEQKDLDGVGSKNHVLAHELGHKMGLPDEYVSNFPGVSLTRYSTGTTPHLPSFSEDDRPFCSDGNAMMTWDRLPRLRYFWHHVHHLEQDAAIQRALAPRHGVRWVATESSYVTPLVYKLADGNQNSPWSEATARGTHGMAPLSSYRLGDDEGMREGIFGANLRTNLDGLVIVRPNIWFTFGSQAAVAGGTDTTDFADDDARWEAMIRLQAACSDRWKSLIRWHVQLPPGSRMERIGLLFQPHFAFAGATEPANTNLHVEVVQDSATPFHTDLRYLMQRSGTTPSMRVGASDVGLAILRVALGVTAMHTVGTKLVVDNSPLGFLELADLGTTVASLFGAAKGLTLPF